MKNKLQNSKKPIPLEKEEDAMFAQWLDANKIKFSHISNEAFDHRMITRNKQIGVRAGVPDFIIFVKTGLLFVEMKRTKNSYASEEQKEWISCLNKIENVEAVICKGADEAIKYVSELI